MGSETIIKKESILKPVLLYTMTSGLGDYLIFESLTRRVESLLPGALCLFIHRNNPHVRSWPHGDYRERFFNVYSASDMARLVSKLHSVRSQGVNVFAFQMAPGSLQGFCFYRLLKRIGAIDYIVDFNLINADIITPPEGKYIYEWHLNQIKLIFNISIPEQFYKLTLCHHADGSPSFVRSPGKLYIGIHPWSRRGHQSAFVWTFERWAQTIQELVKNENLQLVIFGSDPRFEEFKVFMRERMKGNVGQIDFCASTTVSNLISTVSYCDVVVSVNTAVIHIGYALDKKMVILTGPSLDIWIPKGSGVVTVKDSDAVFNGVDRYVSDDRFPSIARIRVEAVLKAIDKLLK